MTLLSMHPPSSHAQRFPSSEPQVTDSQSRAPAVYFVPMPGAVEIVHLAYASFPADTRVTGNGSNVRDLRFCRTPSISCGVKPRLLRLVGCALFRNPPVPRKEF